MKKAAHPSGLLQIDYNPQSVRLLRKFRVQGAKKDQGRHVLPVREDLIFLQQRSSRAFISSLKKAARMGGLLFG